MAVLEIRYLGDPILRKKAAPVTEFGEELGRLVEDLLDTMYAFDGIGLAALQIGLEQRVIVVDVSEARDRSEAIALVNPEIVTSSGTMKGEEGCLSIPGVVAEVERAERVLVRGQHPSGEPAQMEADGLLARVLQHEIDHLNGILFIDRLGPLGRELALKEWNRVAEGRRLVPRGGL